MADLAALAEAQASKVPMSSVPAFAGPVLGADFSWPQCPRGMGIPRASDPGCPAAA